MSARVDTYTGDLAIRQLQNVEIVSKNIKDLMKLRRKITGREYEKDVIELIKAAYDGPFGHNVEDLSSLFCSELVAEAYQCLGLLNDDKPSNEYTPADFSQKRGIKLLRGKLGPEIIIQNSQVSTDNAPSNDF